MEVPQIESDNGYQVGTAYYYDSGGAARVSMAVDLTADAAGKDWWADNYGREPDPALNLPNRTILTWDKYTNEPILPAFVTGASQQQIRGFRAVHTSTADNPTFVNQEYTTNPVAGDEVVFQTPVRNYSFVPVSNVSVSFYAVPMKYDGAVQVLAGPPQPIGDPQVIDQIPAQGSVNVASPVWKAAVQSGVEGIQPWRIFVVLDEKNTIAEVHDWKDANGPCPTSALEPQPANGTVINGVMVDPMTGTASTLACGQNNQGFGEIAVSATADRQLAERGDDRARHGRLRRGRRSRRGAHRRRRVDRRPRHHGPGAGRSRPPRAWTKRPTWSPTSGRTASRSTTKRCWCTTGHPSTASWSPPRRSAARRRRRPSGRLQVATGVGREAHACTSNCSATWPPARTTSSRSRWSSAPAPAGAPNGLTAAVAPAPGRRVAAGRADLEPGGDPMVAYGSAIT